MPSVDLPSTRSASYRYHLLRASLELFRKDTGALSEAERQKAHRLASERLTLQERLLQAPETSALSIPDRVVDEAVSTLRERYPHSTAFLEDVSNAGLTVSGLRQALREELRTEALLEHVAHAAEAVSEQDVASYYHDHIHRFRRPETRYARHILVTVNPALEENTPSAARQRIHELGRQLRRRPEKFSRLAGFHSECPSALRGGVLGWVQPGTLYPSLDRALFTMRAGEISPPLESPLGFHLLHCENIRPAATSTLAEVAPAVRRHLQSRRRRRHLRRWFAALQSAP